MPAKKKVENPELFMQEMTARMEEKGSEGSLHRMLGFPLDYNMGDAMSLLERIKNSKLGARFKNHLAHGIREIHVTPMLKKKAVAAWVRIRASRGEYADKKKKPAVKGKRR